MTFCRRPLKSLSKKAMSVLLAILLPYPFIDASARESSFLDDISKLETDSYSTLQVTEEKKAAPALKTVVPEKKNRKPMPV